MLHIIKTQSGLKDMIDLIQDNDDILLIEDAVYAFFRQSSVIHQLKDQKDRCWALQEDLTARGLSFKSTCDFQSIDFNGFVLLTEQSEQSITWE